MSWDVLKRGATLASPAMQTFALHGTRAAAGDSSSGRLERKV